MSNERSGKLEYRKVGIWKQLEKAIRNYEL